jgi:hypothetical protein
VARLIQQARFLPHRAREQRASTGPQRARQRLKKGDPDKPLFIRDLFTVLALKHQPVVYQQEPQEHPHNILGGPGKFDSNSAESEALRGTRKMIWYLGALEGVNTEMKRSSNRRI